jgi:hypothetical protein
MSGSTSPKNGSWVFSLLGVLAITVSLVVVVGMIVGVARSASGSPLSKSQRAELVTLGASDVDRVLVSDTALQSLVNFSTAKSTEFITANTPPTTIPGSVTPQKCLGIFYRREQPHTRLGGQAVAFDASGNLTSAGNLALKFASGSDAAEDFASIRKAVAECGKYTSQDVTATVPATNTETRHGAGGVDYDVDGALEKQGVPNFETTRLQTFTANQVSYSRTQVEGTYLVGNVLFFITYAFDTKLGTPTWAAHFIATAQDAVAKLVNEKLTHAH